MLAVEKFSRDFADAIKLWHGDDALVRGDLEYAVAGGVDDRFTGADVLFAQFFQDFGAGGRLVAECFAADLFFERLDYFRRGAGGVEGKGRIEAERGHF